MLQKHRRTGGLPAARSLPSFLADPFGRIIAKASHTSEEILIGEIDLGLMEDTRRNWPFLRDRRIDAYGPITKRFLDPVHAWAPDGEAK